jgi:hypothetical protein
MAENAKAFRAWMSEFAAPLKASNKEKRSDDQETERSSASNFSVKVKAPDEKSCFICSEQHQYWRCRKALKMNGREWVQACYDVNRCPVCIVRRPPAGHTKDCPTKCRLCFGKHNSVICSKNRFRLGPIHTNQDQSLKRRHIEEEKAPEFNELKMQKMIDKSIASFKSEQGRVKEIQPTNRPKEKEKRSFRG